MAPRSSPGNVPRSSVTIFDVGYRPGIQNHFLDQVDMGINLGGFVQRVPLSAEHSEELSAERDQLYSSLNRLRLNHDAAELDLEDFMSDQEKLKSIQNKLKRNLSEHAKIMQDAYDRGELNTAMGLEQAHKTLRVELSIHLRDLSQKAFELVETIKVTHRKLSEIEFETTRMKHQLDVIESRLRSANNLVDALKV